MRKRNHVIPIRLNTKEMKHLETQVAVSGLRISPYLDLRGGSACKALDPSCRFAAESCRIV